MKTAEIKLRGRIDIILPPDGKITSDREKERQGLWYMIYEYAEEHHKQRLAEKCEWEYDEECDFYNTSCGSEYALTDGTLKENQHIHCPYCGKEISLLAEKE